MRKLPSSLAFLRLSWEHGLLKRSAGDNQARVGDDGTSAERKREVLIANEQPREDARLRGGSLIEPYAIVPGAEKSRIDVAYSNVRQP